jgi:zinc transporter 9
MGVLVGTSLVVIIPEGIETLYSSNDITQAHKQLRRSLVDTALDPRWGDAGLEMLSQSLQVLRRTDEIDAINALPGPVIPEGLEPITASGHVAPPKTPTTPGEVHALDKPSHQEASESSLTDDTSESHTSSPHAWVGVSLISGFILMYLIDTLPSLKAPAPPQRSNIYSLSDLSSSSPPPQSSQSLPKGSFSTTLGLVIHAAADGIALGASSTQPSLSFIIFFAIMVHKAPAAFGLTSVLLKQGLGKRQARAHLVAFSLAAPAGALFTWMVVRILGGGGGGVSGAQTTKWWTGIILLFSAGTFL